MFHILFTIYHRVKCQLFACVVPLSSNIWLIFGFQLAETHHWDCRQLLSNWKEQERVLCDTVVRRKLLWRSKKTIDKWDNSKCCRPSWRPLWVGYYSKKANQLFSLFFLLKKNCCLNSLIICPFNYFQKLCGATPAWNEVSRSHVKSYETIPGAFRLSLMQQICKQRGGKVFGGIWREPFYDDNLGASPECFDAVSWSLREFRHSESIVCIKGTIDFNWISPIL